MMKKIRYTAYVTALIMAAVLFKGESLDAQAEQIEAVQYEQQDVGDDAAVWQDQPEYNTEGNQIVQAAAGYRQIKIGDSIDDYITQGSDEGSKLYNFTLSESGHLDIRFVSYMAGYSVYLYDQDGKWIWESTSNGWNEATEMVTNLHGIDLMKGTYSLKVSGYKYYAQWNTGNYRFDLAFTPSKETYGNLHNSIPTAASISFNKRIFGQIAEIGTDEEQDYYKFSLLSAGRVKMNLTSYMSQYSLYIYDSNGSPVDEFTSQHWNSATETITNEHVIDLKKGDYYIIVNGYAYYDSWTTGNYNFELKFTSAGEGFQEPNDSVKQATRIAVGQKMNGQIARMQDGEKDADYFVFSLTKPAAINFKMVSWMPIYSMYLYDSSGKEIQKFETNRWQESSQKVTNTHKADLSAGTYYLMVNGYGYYSDWVTGNYQLSSSYAVSSTSMKLSRSSYVYDGKLKKPTVSVYANQNKLTQGRDYSLTYSSNKYPGQAKAKVKLTGAYSGGLVKTFIIKPKAPVLTKVSGGKRKVTARWKKVVSVSGYQIQYAANKRFSGKRTIYAAKGKATAKTISGLRGKKRYYVRIRAYKNSGRSRIYSGYSKTRSAAAKK